MEYNLFNAHHLLTKCLNTTTALYTHCLHSDQNRICINTFTIYTVGVFHIAKTEHVNM